MASSEQNIMSGTACQESTQKPLRIRCAPREIVFRTESTTVCHQAQYVRLADNFNPLLCRAILSQEGHGLGLTARETAAHTQAAYIPPPHRAAHSAPEVSRASDRSAPRATRNSAISSPNQVLRNRMKHWRLPANTVLVDLCARIHVCTALEKQLSRIHISVFRGDMKQRSHRRV